MPRPISVLALAAVLAAGAPALRSAWAAVASEKPVDTDRIMGRWYEILRTPNKLEKNCYASYQEWSRQGDAFAIHQVCHKDSPDGRIAEIGATAKPLNRENTLFDASFFGGLIHARYQVADHAADYSWLIATTADGRYPKLLAREPDLPPAEQDALKQRMARMGFNVARLEPVAGRETP